MRHFISLGAGVQSSTMLLMAIHGEIEPKPEAAIFADTGWEPKKVYEWFQWLKLASEVAGIPVITASKGNIKEDTLNMSQSDKSRFASMPFFVRNKKGEGGRLRRQCTKEYKIEVVQQAIRHRLGLEPKQRAKQKVSMWMGISVDEIGRAKHSRVPWIMHRFPLLESHMTRNDCLNWLERKGYPRPPKSSCIGCPYHDNAFWRQLKADSWEEWEEAVAFDKHIRNISRIDGEAYLHRSLKPLDEVDLRTDEEKGQLSLFGEFGEECEGMCGV